MASEGPEDSRDSRDLGVGVEGWVIIGVVDRDWMTQFWEGEVGSGVVVWNDGGLIKVRDFAEPQDSGGEDDRVG